MTALFPTLELERLRIVNFSKNHLSERYIAWLNDPEVVQFSEQRHMTHSLASCQTYFTQMQMTSNYFLAIESKEYDFGHVGNIGVTVDLHNRIADMSILMGEKRVWGTGLATIAWTVVMKRLLIEQNFRKVTAGTLEKNKPMLRLMERSGMHIESVRKKHFLWRDEEVDVIQAAIFRK